MSLLRTKVRFFIWPLFAVLGLAGCSTNNTIDTDPKVDLIAEVQASADKLLTGLVLKTSKPLISVSFANIDNLDESSTLGRILGEQFSNVLTSKGIEMIEIKLRNKLYISKGNGELMLSRDLKRIVNEYEAQAILVGTYAQGGKYLYVTSRIVNMDDNTILSADNMSLPINKDIRGMLPRKRYQ